MKQTLWIWGCCLWVAAALHGQVFWSRAFMADSSTGSGTDFSSHGGSVSGAWTGNGTQPTPEFLKIDAVGAGGGELGVGSNGTLNLSARTDLRMVVSLRLPPENQVESILVGLRSGVGNEALWSLPAASFEPGAFVSVAADLSGPPAESSGTLDWSAVDRVLVRVASTGPERFVAHLERIALAEIPSTGIFRVVGTPQAADPYGAAYYSSIQDAVDSARPRDTVWVRPGIYYETVVLARDYGLPEAALRIVADPSGPVILDGQAGLDANHNLTGRSIGFDWSNSQTAGDMIRANHIHIEGFIVRNFATMGFGNQNPGRITIRHCLVHGNGGSGIGMNYPRADTRLRVLANVLFLNGWGEAWGSGIHLNNKDVRLHSIATDASGNELPEDPDPGHEIIGNISFLNLDESEYNSDGNGIMLDFGGGSEATISDNIVFLNAGAGLRNLNGRVRFQRNIVYRNGWDHRAAPGAHRSTNEQIGFLIKHDVVVSPGISTDDFLQRHYPQFLKSRLSNNLVWTASRFNLYGPYYAYTTDANQTGSLSQFALDYGLWSLFNGKPDASKWWRVQYGHKLNPAFSGANAFTDDQIGLVNPGNASQTVQPLTRQAELSNAFSWNAADIFVRHPGPDYEPPAIAHIYGHALFGSNGTVTLLSETTSPVGMAWNPSVKKNISLKLATVVGSHPPLDLASFDFTVPDSAPANLRACRPSIAFAPAYRATFESYLRSQFDGGNPACKLPYTFAASAAPALPVAVEPSTWLQAEDLYSTTAHRQVAPPRWRFAAADGGPFGSPALVAYDLPSLSDLNRANALVAGFSLTASAAPIARLVVRAPTGGNANNDSLFVRVLRLPTEQPVVLPLSGIHQVPPPLTLSKLKLTHAGSGWYRVFFDQESARTSAHLHLPLPTLAAGSYEVQIQNRQADVWLDRLGIFSPGDFQLAVAANAPGVTWADWQEAHLGAALAASPPHGDPLADGSGNGVENLIQVAMGAKTTDATPPRAQPTVESDGRAGIEFFHNGLLAGMTAAVQFSNNLDAWTDAAVSAGGGAFQALDAQVAVEEGLGAARWVSVSAPSSGAKLFWRIRYSLP